MPIHLLGLVLALAAAVHSPADSRFDSRFTGRTLRFDYFHSGIAKEEHVSFDGLRREGDWPGSRSPRGADGGPLPGDPREDDAHAPRREVLRPGRSLPGRL